MVDAPSNWKSRARLALLATAVVGVFACCGGLVYFWDVPLEGGRLEQWEADLEERLPEGSSWKQAEQWFESHGIKPGYFEDSNGRRLGLLAVIPNSTLIENAEIQIFLYFDDSGKLRKRNVRRYVVSL